MPLRDCFESTDWSVLQDSFGEDIEGVTHCTTDYLNFCMDIVAPTKTVRCFPNNKPWITSNVKHLLNRKKRAFKEGGQEERKRVQGDHAERGKGLIQKEGGAEAAGEQYERGVGWHENHHRLQEEQQLCRGGCGESTPV